MTDQFRFAVAAAVVAFQIPPTVAAFAIATYQEQAQLPLKVIYNRIRAGMLVYVEGRLEPATQPKMTAAEIGEQLQRSVAQFEEAWPSVGRAFLQAASMFNGVIAQFREQWAERFADYRQDYLDEGEPPSAPPELPAIKPGPDCARCYYYAHSGYVCCSLYPYGPEAEQCPDHRRHR